MNKFEKIFVIIKGQKVIKSFLNEKTAKEFIRIHSNTDLALNNKGKYEKLLLREIKFKMEDIL